MTATRQGPKDPSDATQVARAVARRLDTNIDPRLTVAERQIRKLGDGFAVLLQRQAAQPAGQPDWLGCRNADAAKTLLRGTRTWVEDVAAVLGFSPPRSCWPWHPHAVALFLAAASHYRAAYVGDSASAVSDYLTRYLPTAYPSRVAAAIGDQCNGPLHATGEALYAYDLDRLDDYAVWWAMSREGLPPGLRPHVEAVR